MTLNCAAVAGVLAFAASGSTFASDFFVYPVREIEGLNSTNKAAGARPLVDPRTAALISPEAQKQILSAFTTSLATAYPKSIVHSSQVRDSIKEKYKYAAGGTTCGDGFVAPIDHSYAMVAGVSRASYYEVDRGENLEILIPITLNVQVVKAERAKIVYTASSTQYTPFVFSRKELGEKATKDFITKSLTANTVKQLTELVEQIKANFNPKDTPIKLTSKIGDYIVADKGFEVGFKVGDEPEGIASKADGGEAIVFKVISVGNSYSVLKALAGTPRIGEEYVFVFEGPAEDGRKPKLMPVPVMTPEAVWSLGVADMFAKDIGFKAPFQITPVDINFGDTMNSIRAQANCVPWDKFPSAKTVFDSRTDYPNYYLRFELGQSPVFTQQGKGAVKTEEHFSTVLTAQVIDKDGNVAFSELGRDSYLLERVGKQGLSLPNAKEISTKNALVDLMKGFLQNVKLEPREFAITDAQQKAFTVKGFEVAPGQDVSYEVIHPVGAKVNGVDVFIKLSLDQGAEPPATSHGNTVFSYSNTSPDYPNVSKGDIFRVLTMPKGNLPELSSCGTVYMGKDSLAGGHLLPVINNVAYHSQTYNVSISQPEFYDSANMLLKDGFFKHRLRKPEATEYCFKPGYLVKAIEKTCDGDGCNGKMMTAIKLIVEKKGVEVKDSSIGEQTVVKGFNESQATNIILFRSMLSGLNISAELSKRFNSK